MMTGHGFRLVSSSMTDFEIDHPPSFDLHESSSFSGCRSLPGYVIPRREAAALSSAISLLVFGQLANTVDWMNLYLWGHDCCYYRFFTVSGLLHIESSWLSAGTVEAFTLHDMSTTWTETYMSLSFLRPEATKGTDLVNFYHELARL